MFASLFRHPAAAGRRFRISASRYFSVPVFHPAFTRAFIMRIFPAKRRTAFAWLIGTASLFLCLQRAHSATFNIADGDVAGLTNAIWTAVLGSDPTNTINLAPSGTYTMTTGDQFGRGIRIFLYNFLTLNGNGATIARSTANGTPTFTIFQSTVMHNAGPTGLTINNLTIRNGRENGGSHEFGGGIFFSWL